ncbi:MAG: hypothetical protein J0I79_26560 [Mesorhizobium sp.]|uniref:hypothetical protein n=1 Tax=Mesorhizobium sp. TaxID=1871066 RepID=UPI001AD5D3B4|nr:hypothetical protein [Mesorhizobium sp.]MBN9221522.1 hypothetical protein [Mesorhizobium sp.]
MQRQIVLLGSVALMLAGAIPLATAADAAVMKHHRHHLVRASAHDEAGYVDATNRGHERRGGWFGGWTAENSTSDQGWMDSFYNGYGSYRGQPGDICGTIEWTVGLCGPHGP